MPRCYVPAAGAAGSRLALSDEEAHHVTRVLRLGVGDRVIAFDGRGHDWDARLVDVSRRGATIELVAARAPVSEPTVAITLAVSVLKGDQMDAVVRDATALGVARVVPVVTEHVSVPERAWSRAGLDERWRRVAIAAAKQCGRAVVPEIASVLPLASAWRDASAEARIVCVEPAHGAASDGLGPRPASVWLWVGPEGGWSADELSLLSSGEARRLTLGPRTLRAELAPVVALAAVWSAWGW